MSELPAYHSTRTCPKCRTTRLSVAYRSHRPRLVWTAGQLDEIVHLGVDQPQECLLRTCQACDWAWLEACADPSQDSRPAEMVSSIDTHDGGHVQFAKPMPRDLAEQFATDFHAAIEAGGPMDFGG